MSFPLLKEFKRSTGLIDIQCGTALSITISITPSQVMFDGKTFLSEPRVKVVLPKQTGGLAEEACKISIPREGSQHAGVATLAQLLSTPRALPPTTVRIYNLIRTGPEETQVLYLYEGVLDKDLRNPQGQSGMIEMQFTPEHMLGLEDLTLGRRADATCDLIYGGLGCYADVEKQLAVAEYYPSQFEKIFQAKVICTLDPQSTGRRVTLELDPAVYFSPTPDPRTLTDHSPKWWNRGWLEREGLRILIADWRWDFTVGRGSNAFILSRMPPLSWDGAQLTLKPGCQKTPQACAKRLRTEWFGGLGYGIPAYNPVLESSDS